MPDVQRRVTDIHELISIVDLAGIRFDEVSARRLEEDAEPEQGFEMGVENQRSSGHLGVRFRLSSTNDGTEYVVVVATRYVLEEPVEVDEEVMVEFVERVAVMAAYPFLREATATLAARLEVDVPMLGLLKAGEFKLHPKTAASEQLSKPKPQADSATEIAPAAHT